MIHFSAKTQAAKILHGFCLSWRYQRSPWFHEGAWVNRIACVRTVNKFCHLPCWQGHNFQGSKLFTGTLWSLPVPPDTSQAQPCCLYTSFHPDWWAPLPPWWNSPLSHYPLFCLPPLLLSDAFSFTVHLLSHTPTPLPAISPAFEQKHHPLQIPRKPSCCQVCDRKWTRHSQTEISRLHWNLKLPFSLLLVSSLPLAEEPANLSFLRVLRRQFC